jgi:hypothetical protein
MVRAAIRKGNLRMVTKAQPRDRLPPAQRSAVTNGRKLFAQGGDMRSPWVRRFRDVQFLHLSDLGGPAAVSESENSLVRRVATLTVQLEALEAKFSADTDVDIATLDAYQRGTNTLRRLLETLGIKRRPRDVTPDLNSYLEANYEIEG